MKKRTIVYIDGFNLYYGLLRKLNASKWLDLWELSQSLVSKENEIVAVKYFTSRVNYDPREPSAKANQEIYLRALEKLGNIEIIEGYYQRRDTKMPFRFEPCISCRPYADVVRIEEKRSDVNLATAMMADFHEEKADSFVVISGDADLVAPIEYIRKKGSKNVVVFNPHASISGDLKKHATYYKNIPRDLPISCRLPDEIVYGSHSRIIRCPDAWRLDAENANQTNNTNPTISQS